MQTVSTQHTKNEIKGWAFQVRSAVLRNHQGEKLADQEQVSITERQFKVKRWFRWQYVSLSVLNEMSEEHQHLTICAPDWENVTAANLTCFFQSLSTELSAKSYILKGHFVR